MATLASGISLRSVGRIVFNAMATGAGAWDASGNGQQHMADEPTLSADILALFQLLHQRNVPYLLVGGVALLRYVEARNTEDIDLVLSFDALPNVPEIQVVDRNPDFARGRFRSVRVDLLSTTNPLFKLVSDRFATSHRFQELDVRIATVEGLVLLKLYALPSLYRQGDGQRIALYEADIAMLYQRHRTDLSSLAATLKPFLDPAAHTEVSNIIQDIQRWAARIDRASGTQP